MNSEDVGGKPERKEDTWRFGVVTIKRWGPYENIWIPSSQALANALPLVHPRLCTLSPRKRFPLAVIDIDGKGHAVGELLSNGKSRTEALLQVHRATQAALIHFAKEVQKSKSSFADIQYIVGISRIAIPGLERFGWQIFDFDAPRFSGASHSLAKQAYLGDADSRVNALPARLAVMSRSRLLATYGNRKE